MLGVSIDQDKIENEGARSQIVSIYRASFPNLERKNEDEFLSMANRNDYIFVTAKKIHIIIGFSAIKILEDNLFLLEYMAIEDSCRKFGIGGKLFEKSLDMIGRNSTLLLEVDSDDGSSGDNSQNRRRKKFYFSHGCGELKCLKYIMPLHGKKFIPMNIMIWRNIIPNAIDKCEVRSWLNEIYTKVYGLEHGDKRIDVMLNDLDDNVFIVGG